MRKLVWSIRVANTVTSVRIERLWDLTGEEALKEGFLPEEWTGSKEQAAKLDNMAGLETKVYDECRLLCLFALLWDGYNAKAGHGWNSNPWCWKIGIKPESLV